jgi:hypothetical protein
VRLVAGLSARAVVTRDGTDGVRVLVSAGSP